MTLTRAHRFSFSAPLMLAVCLWLAMGLAAQAKSVPLPKSPGEWTGWVARAEQKYQEKWAVVVEDLYTGRIVYEYAPERRLIPASNRKLVTLAMALDLLGRDYCFETSMGLFGAPPQPGQQRYEGDVMVRAQGDPSLGPPFLSTPSNPAELLDQWARELATQGVLFIDGDLVVDASAFGADQAKFPSVWNPDYKGQAYAPLPSAVSLNSNLLRVTISPGSSPGRAGRLSVFPSPHGLELENHTRTTSRSATGINASFGDQSTSLMLKGYVHADKGQEVLMLPLEAPLDYVAGLMRASLTKAGVSLKGGNVIRTEPWLDLASTATLHVTSTHTSPKLDSLLLTMMRRSNNFLAEQIWRAAAVKACGRGDLTSARMAEMQWFRRYGLSWIEPGYDGSGLSARNQLAPVELVRILKVMYHSSNRDLLLDVLPQSGRSGTLRHRSFSKTDDGRVLAKTGTLAGASSLSGFILDRNRNPRYAFSVIGNAPGDTNGRLAERTNVLIKLMIASVDDQALQPQPTPAAMLAPSQAPQGGMRYTIMNDDLGDDDSFELSTPSRPLDGVLDED